MNVVVLSRSIVATAPLHPTCGSEKSSMLGGRGMLLIPRAALTHWRLTAVSRMISPNPSVTMAR